MNYRHVTKLLTNRASDWRLAGAVAAAVAGLTSAHGAVSTWTNGGGDNAWSATSATSDWSPAGLPTTSSTVVFASQGTTAPIAIDTASVGVIDFGGVNAATAVSGALGYTLGTSPGSGTINIGAGTGTVNQTFVNYFGTSNTATQLINANLNLGSTSDTDGWVVVNNAPGLLEFSGTLTGHSTVGTRGALWIQGTGTTILTSTSSIKGLNSIEEAGPAGSTAILQGTISLNASITVGNLYNGSYGNLLLQTDKITDNNLLSIFAGAGGSGAIQFQGDLNLASQKVSISDGRFQAGAAGGFAHVENISGNTTIGTLTLANANSLNVGTYTNIQLDAGTLTIASIGTTLKNTTDTQTLYFYGTGNGNAVVSGSISDTGAGLAPIAIEENNAGGILTLKGANTYVGGTILDAGTLVAGNAQAFGVNGSAVTLNGGTLDLATDSSIDAYNVTVTSDATILSDKATAASAGITQTLGALNIGAATLNVQAGANVSGGTPVVAFGATTLTGGTSVFKPTTANVTLGSVTGAGSSGTNTLNLDGTSSGNTVGAITDSSAGAVTAISKTNSSTWTLTGTNTNTGATTITAGTLILTGKLGSGLTTVTNAIFEGNGTLTGALVVGDGGILAPGVTDTSRLGTLTASSVVLASTATLSFFLNSDNVSSDLLAVNGDLTLNGATLSIADIGSTLLAADTTIVLASYTGALSGNFNGLADGSDITIGVNTFQIDYGTLDAGEITLEAVASVPEPSVYALLAAGLVLVFLVRRFVRRDLRAGALR